MDYYSTLGLKNDALAEDIKKAYRKLAAKHHPDRGGSTEKFQEIQAAYDTLGDEAKRRNYDNPQPAFGQGGFPPGFEEAFSQFGFMGRRQARKNKAVSIQVPMSLDEVINGKDVIGDFRLPSGRSQTLQIKIPKGVKNGDQIRYQGLGDDSIPGIPKGDLVANIVEIANPTFLRQGDNLYKNILINSFDAMLGTNVRTATVDNKELEIAIPAGIQHGQMIRCQGYGVPGDNRGIRGSMFLKIVIETVQGISEQDIAVLKTIKEKYGSR